MNRRVLTAGLLTACLAAAALSPTLGRRGQTQHEMNRQAARDYQKADAELNRTYRSLYAALDKNRRAKLKAAQLAWLKFRDAESAFVSSEMEGGSAQPMLYSGALADLTKKRAKELKEAYEVVKSH